MRTLSIHILALCMGLIAPGMHAMKKSTQSIETTAISFDLDGVISGSITIPKSDYESRNLKVLRQRHPLLATALKSNIHLEETFERELEKTQPHLILRVQPIIDIIRQLKARGYTVVAATNQDRCYHNRHRKTFRDIHSVDFKNLFDATLTANDDATIPCPLELLDCLGISSCYQWLTNESHLYSTHNAAEHIYTMNDYSILKPKAHYYQALEHLVKRKNPNVTQIIHIDDMGNNILGAADYGFKVSHFDIDVLNADVATLAAAITKLKNDLRRHGIECD
jgi:FMN phosphatase YigB (HAD superfamily)